MFELGEGVRGGCVRRESETARFFLSFFLPAKRRGFIDAPDLALFVCSFLLLGWFWFLVAGRRYLGRDGVMYGVCVR